MKHSLQNLNCSRLTGQPLEGLLLGNICTIQCLIEIYFVYRNREDTAKTVVLLRSTILNYLDPL